MRYELSDEFPTEIELNEIFEPAAPEEMLPRHLLNAAANVNLDTVLILGWTKNSEPYAACNNGDKRVLLWLLERFKHKLLAGDYDPPEV